jgi:CTP-dependent riboflavin kinase
MSCSTKCTEHDSDSARRLRMKLLAGTVGGGFGVAANNLRHAMSLIEERTGLSPLVAGTLNVALAEPYVVCADAVIDKHEYNTIEYIKLQRCRISGLQAIIMRPNTHELGYAHGPAHLELMATVKLRDRLHLSDGAQVTVEVEGDERCWQGFDA